MISGYHFDDEWLRMHAVEIPCDLNRARFITTQILSLFRYDEDLSREYSVAISVGEFPKSFGCMLAFLNIQLMD